MKTYFNFFIIATLLAISMHAQENTVLGNGIFGKDQSNNDGKVIQQATVREADVAWSKRIWRVIDVREKINQPLYFPLKPLQERKSLFDILMDAILNDRLTAYDNPSFDDEFKSPMLVNQVKNVLVKWDSTHTTEDPETGALILAPIKKEITGENVTQYLIKEDWFFDKQRSVLDVRIIGICPLAEDFNDNGEFRGYKRLFWIYFPEVRNVLVHQRAFTRGNYASTLTFDDIFVKRMFNSVIVKESNVFDRSILEGNEIGVNGLLAGEKIKENMTNWESDLWHY